MKLNKDVNLQEIAKKAIDFNGSELKALSTEAGYLAIKENKKEISHQNFLDAIEVVRREEEAHELLTHSFH